MKQKSEKGRKYKIDKKGNSIEWKVPKSFQVESHKGNRENEEEATYNISWEVSRTFERYRNQHTWRSKINKFKIYVDISWEICRTPKQTERLKNKQEKFSSLNNDAILSNVRVHACLMCTQYNLSLTHELDDIYCTLTGYKHLYLFANK